jgi:hypothetical protein
MSILHEIQESLKPISKTQNSNKRSGFSTAMSIIEDFTLDDARMRIETVLVKYQSKGEKIITVLQNGEILDRGMVHFKILAGFIIEFYDYEHTTSVFIRMYQISDGNKEWLAVYIDQNPKTPWW